MVDTSLAAFRLLELVALLFPVVALLLQLQYRAVDTDELERLGISAGTSLLGLLSLSFLLLSLHIVSVQPLPPFLSVALVGLSVISLLLPLLVVFSSRKFTEQVKEVPQTIADLQTSVRRAWDSESETESSDESESDEGQN